jgi:Bacterial regulatory helix-turn-helix protein, lysR family
MIRTGQGRGLRGLCRRRCVKPQQLIVEAATVDFLAAAEHGSFTAAADVLHLARPSVSVDDAAPTLSDG